MRRSLVFFVLFLKLLSVSNATLVCVAPVQHKCHSNGLCLNISLLLQQADNYFTSGASIEFLPGNYTVENTSYVVVRDISGLTITVSTNVATPDFHPPVTIDCDGRASLTFVNVTNLYISGIEFLRCGLLIPKDIAREATTVQTHSLYVIPPGVHAALFFANVSFLNINNVHVRESYGYGLLGFNVLGSSNITNSTFDRNNINAQFQEPLGSILGKCNKTYGSGSYCQGGGALFVYQDTPTCPHSEVQSHLAITNSVFMQGIGPDSIFRVGREYNNSHYDIGSSSGVGIILGQTSYSMRVLIQNVTFDMNTGLNGANLLVFIHAKAQDTNLQIADSTFANANLEWSSADINNTSNETEVESTGGFWYSSGYLLAFPSGFKPVCGCGLIEKLHSRNLVISGSMFYNNSVSIGAAAFIELRDDNHTHDTLSIRYCTITKSNATTAAVLYLFLSSFKYTASIVYCSIKNNTVKSASIVSLKMYTSAQGWNKVTIQDTEFVGNNGTDAATLRAEGNTPLLIRNSTFANNNQTFHKWKATSTVYLMTVENIIITDCTFVMNNGSAVAALNSTIYFNGTVTFVGNNATQGAALALYYKRSVTENYSQKFLLELAPSRIYFHNHTHLHIANNTATERGGAIFFEDLPTTETYPCFYQICDLENINDFHERNITIILDNNTATFAGDSIFGGMNRLCTINKLSSNAVFNSLFTVSEPWSPSEFSSDPDELVFCDDNTPQINTETHENHIHQDIHPGKTFNISAVAIGDKNNHHLNYSAVPAVINAVIPHHSGKLGSQQNAQTTEKMCINLTFTLNTSERRVDIFLSVETKSYVDIHYTTHSHLNITLLPCPLGFTTNDYLACDCIQKLCSKNCICNIDDGTVRCPAGAWVGLSNNTTVLFHDHCPFDYCVSKSVAVSLDNPDTQCALKHSGILCGACASGLSLTLGTFQCLQCSNKGLWLLIPFALAGLALVFMILGCNLTVSAGTLNGMIYFANVVQVNHSSFFTTTITRPLAIFIAWLNLDLGFETCFYDGLDMYERAWLQFVFPLYLWMIAGAIIFLGRYSALLSRLNAVPSLATLFFLSYAKLLRAIITVLSFTYLELDNKDHMVVWLHDGNLEFLKGRHIFLFIAAVIALVGFILPYTFILLLAPYLQAMSTYCFFSWINRLKPFLDAYQGPYKNRYRNWIGFLILACETQFMLFALNVFGNPGINLLVIIIASAGVLTLTLNFGGVYKSHLNNLIESFLILLLAIIAAASLYVQSATSEPSERQKFVTFPVMTVALVTFVLIFAYHCFISSKKLPLSNLAVHILRKRRTEESQDQGLTHSLCQPQQPQQMPTMTYVGLRESLLEEISVSGSTTSKCEQQQMSTAPYIELREPLLEDN